MTPLRGQVAVFTMPSVPSVKRAAPTASLSRLSEGYSASTSYPRRTQRLFHPMVDTIRYRGEPFAVTTPGDKTGEVSWAYLGNRLTYRKDGGHQDTYPVRF
jgi:hypothetical protein